MEIQSAKYILHDITGENTSIACVLPDMNICVPINPANTDYAEIMRQVEAGELTIKEADSE